MLSNKRLMEIAESIHDLTDADHVVHNSKCSYMWRQLDDNKPEDQSWVAYFMNVTRINSEDESMVMLQLAKLGSCHICGTELLIIETADYDQCETFESFLVRAA